MTANEFRRIALGHEGVVEGAHMRHPDFRLKGKIFATLNEDQTRGMVALTPAQQAEVLREHPQMFAPASGAWGRQGCTMVELTAADAEVVGEAMTLAWRGAAAKATKARAGKSVRARRR